MNAIESNWRGRGKEAWAIGRKVVAAWIAHNASSTGAALAFYTLFAIAPIVVFAVGLAGAVFGSDVANTHILDQIRGLIGDTGASAVQALLAGIDHRRKSGGMAVISIVTLVVGATSVFGELQNALDTIWATPSGSGIEGIWQFVRQRFLSLGMILGVGFLALVSLLASAALAVLGSWIGSFTPGWQTVLSVLNLIVGFGLITLLFALIYKYVPREKIAWGDVWIGSLVTATLFEVGKALIGIYLGRNSLTSAYGAAGSFVVLLLWVYYSAQIFLLGAEFTCVFAYRHGSRLPPPAGAGAGANQAAMQALRPASLAR